MNQSKYYTIDLDEYIIELKDDIFDFLDLSYHETLKYLNFRNTVSEIPNVHYQEASLSVQLNLSNKVTIQKRVVYGVF